MGKLAQAMPGCTCQCCGQLYTLDVSVPDDVWELIKPAGKPEGAGLLCPQCTADRLIDLGLRPAVGVIACHARRCRELEAQLCGQLVEHPGRKDMLLVLAELRRAKSKYPAFKPTLALALNVLDDEHGELASAILKGDIDGPHGVIREAAQVAAVAIRIIELSQQVRTCEGRVRAKRLARAALAATEVPNADA